MTPIQYFSLFSLVSNNLTNYGRRHFKPFTNFHVGEHPFKIKLRKINSKKLNAPAEGTESV